MLAHVHWPVVAKGNPMKGKGKTHRWRVLSSTLPNYDFVQHGVSIKDASFPGGLAPITVSRQDSLLKAPPKQQQLLVWKPPKDDDKSTVKEGTAVPSRKKAAWPKELAGESTAVIDVDAQAEVVTGGAVAVSTTSSSSASGSSSSSSSGGGAAPMVSTPSTNAAPPAAAPPPLFTPEQARLMQDSTNQLKLSLAGELKAMLGEAIVDIKATFMSDMSTQVKGLESKIAEVASEKKAKTGGVSSV